MNRAPTDTRDVVDLDATLGEQFLDVALRQPEAQLPTDSQDDHSGGNRKPAKADGGTGPRRGRVLMPAVSPPRRRHGQRNSAFTTFLVADSEGGEQNQDQGGDGQQSV
jgi:hypothetical protein